MDHYIKILVNNSQLMTLQIHPIHIGYNQLYKVLLWFFNDFIIYNLTDYASSFKITLVKYIGLN